MLLQKTLHMGQSLPDCRTRLANIHSYRRQFVMVTRATVTSSKTVDFSFRGPLGFEAHTVLLAIEGDSPDEVAFESVGGNLDLMGIVDFTEVRPNCTEITLAVHYEIKNKFFAWLDHRLHFMDAFVNRELRSIRAHFEGIAAPYSEPASILPMLETATA
jgi:hypothetical protein